MEKVKKAYRVDTKRKVIVLDDEVKMTSQELDDVKFYVSCGYEIKHKSIKKAEKAKATARKTAQYTKEYILESLKGNEEALAEFNDILQGKGSSRGWFAAKSWYINNFVEKK